MMSSKTPVAVVRTGTANLASVLAGLRRAGSEPYLTDLADDILSAPRLILPGVGAFAAAMEALREKKLVEPLVQRLQQDKPTMTICLGLQLLAKSSEESPGESGFGLIDADVKRFPATVRVPQLGWNKITPVGECKLLREGYVYFANSYRLEQVPEGWSGAVSDHAGPFVGALEKGNLLACQFHPELSGEFGASLLERWVEGGDAC